ncbi:MAG TPA: response regulator transcription factor [Vicinamibacterales bacterium]|nr:response regulator transcription factor [Vicinamibacterales bacterium]
MTAVPALARGRELFHRKSWGESYRLLEAADREAPLEPEDLEQLATAAYLVGRDDESEGFRARAHQMFLARGDCEGAARSAAWLAFGLLQRGARAPASGWFARAEHILDEAHLDSVARGFLLIPSAIQRIVQGDPSAGHAAFTQAAEIANRFGDRDLASLACSGRGRALIYLGQIAEGVALLDEAMVAVIAGDVSPVLAGDIYCSVLEACQETFDLRRAYEWTVSLAQWCAAQPGLVRYRGECLLYRAEVMQWLGKWDDAARDAQAACELLMSRPAAGAAFYRLGEIHRLRGEFAKAETAYTRANERGRRPQPGWSLLRLAQGQIDAAGASIRGVLLDTKLPAARARMLGAAVEILLAGGDRDNARAGAAELSEIASAFDAPLLSAASAHATGAVLLAEGDVAGAATALHRALEIWRNLETPYEEADTCLLMAAVCERRGDLDGRRLELDTARRLFKALNAEPRLARIAEQSGRATRQSVGSLSEREVQVIRLLAAGKTNRDIAEALFISDRTVARHVSNIFDKLGVSTRTGAAAWAYQHHLV